MSARAEIRAAANKLRYDPILNLFPGANELSDWLEDALLRRYHEPTAPDYALNVARAINEADSP